MSTEKGFAALHLQDAFVEDNSSSADYFAMLHELRTTFRTGVTKSVSWRKHQLGNLINLIKENTDAIREAVQADLGGPDLRGVFDMGAIEQAAYAISMLDRWTKDEKVSFGSPWGSNVIRHEPKGVVLVIAPWNFPFDLALGPMVAVLAAGNCCVLKPSEVASASCELLTKLIPQYMSRSAVRVVAGGPPEVTALLELRWDHIMYTGNGSVGRIIMAAAAKHLTPVTLELGGKSPVIVDKTANIQLAAKRIVQGKFAANAGQVCISPDFVLVEGSVESELLGALKHEARELLGDSKEAHGVGAPAEEAGVCLFGRIINERHVRRINDLVRDCGGRMVLGRREDIDATERYVPPLIISRPRDDAELLQQEIFGPVLPVVPVGSMDDAIARSRSICEHPLALYVFSEDAPAVERILKALDSGGASVNSTMEHAMTPQMPFGGVGESGMGVYHGRAGFEEFSHKRSILYRTTLLPLTMLPGAPVIKAGRVAKWMYGLALKMQVTGVLSERSRALLRLVAMAVIALLTSSICAKSLKGRGGR